MENVITKVFAEEIKDSRGNPTLKVTVCCGDMNASFSVPSGASTGIHEAHELRDEDGKGVENAVKKINEDISSLLVGESVLDQNNIDHKMINFDGTTNKDNLGGNSMIGVSIACAKVAAKISDLELYEYLRTIAEIKPSRKVPHLYMNLINGGKHAKNNLAFQEYHIVTDTDNIKDAVEIGINIQKTLNEIIEEDLGDDSLTLGDEGGYAPQISDIRQPLVYLQESIIRNNLEGKVRLALDVASSSFYKDGKYEVDGQLISKEDLMNIYDSLILEFNLLSIEDPFDEEDFESFRNLKNAHTELIVMGDDLTVTNKNLLTKAIENNSINAMIIKPNQIGTLTETLDTMKLARENNIELIVSHRSGETDDDFIADLCYAFSCFGLKSGSPIKSERMVKYERLIKISEII